MDTFAYSQQQLQTPLDPVEAGASIIIVLHCSCKTQCTLLSRANAAHIDRSLKGILQTTDKVMTYQRTEKNNKSKKSACAINSTHDAKEPHPRSDLRRPNNDGTQDSRIGYDAQHKTEQAQRFFFRAKLARREQQRRAQAPTKVWHPRRRPRIRSQPDIHLIDAEGTSDEPQRRSSANTNATPCRAAITAGGYLLLR